MDFSTSNTVGVETIFTTAVTTWNAFMQSGFFLGLKIFLILYVLIVFADLVMMLILKGVGGDIRKGLRGMDIPTVTKSKMQKQWDKVLERLETGNSSQYKVAILEADSIADKLLAGIGYAGNNMSERLAQIRPEQLDYYTDELEKVHQLRNRIVHEADFTVDEQLARETVAVYQKFLKYLEYL